MSENTVEENSASEPTSIILSFVLTGIELVSVLGSMVGIYKNIESNIYACISLYGILVYVIFWIIGYCLYHPYIKNRDYGVKWYRRYHILTIGIPFIVSAPPLLYYWFLLKETRRDMLEFSNIFIICCVAFALTSILFIHLFSSQREYEGKITQAWDYSRGNKQICPLINHGAVSYAATCIPFSPKENGTIDVCLIENKSYKTTKGTIHQPWMFPGGHVELSAPAISHVFTDNEIQELLFNDSRKSPLPHDIAKSKATMEAGLNNVKLISEISDDNHPAYCTKVPSPNLTYVLKISENAKCRKMRGHLVHYDFTYIAIYDGFLSGNSHYKRVIVSVPQSVKNPTEISTMLLSEINKELQGQNRKKRNSNQYPASELFHDSIPVMLFDALKIFNESKRG